ncbi:hypothetical protein [Paraburkholderia sp. D1E]|uniref:hypothetical protein n=1 Tax=Paraburkholderia sp. D1E TaxID=3461398 RepID=UPI004045AB18
MREQFYFDEKNLMVAEDVWTELKKGNEVTFSSIKSTVADTLARGGAFIIHDIEGNVMRRFDRLSEFESHVRDIDGQRK